MCVARMVVTKTLRGNIVQNEDEGRIQKRDESERNRLWGSEVTGTCCHVQWRVSILVAFKFVGYATIVLVIFTE